MATKPRFKRNVRKTHIFRSQEGFSFFQPQLTLEFTKRLSEVSPKFPRKVHRVLSHVGCQRVVCRVVSTRLLKPFADFAQP